jgi:hypothetical protein
MDQEKWGLQYKAQGMQSNNYKYISVRPHVDLLPFFEVFYEFGSCEDD